MEAGNPLVRWLRPLRPKGGWALYYGLLVLPPVLAITLGTLLESELTGAVPWWQAGAGWAAAILFVIGVTMLLQRAPKPATIGLASEGILIELWQGRRLNSRFGFHWPDVRLRGHVLHLYDGHGRLRLVVRLDDQQLTGLQSFRPGWPSAP